MTISKEDHAAIAAAIRAAEQKTSGQIARFTVADDRADRVERQADLPCAAPGICLRAVGLVVAAPAHCSRDKSSAKSNAGLSFLTSSFRPRRRRQEPARSQKLSVVLWHGRQSDLNRRPGSLRSLADFQSASIPLAGLQCLIG
jgi:hypothetical protein